MLHDDANTKQTLCVIVAKKNNHSYIMLQITNTKVAGFDARWDPFHGFSILFNNPGDHCLQQRRSGILDLANDISSDSALYFYKILYEGVTHLDINYLTNNFLFCALPSNAYHVTLWGGLNYRHLTQVNSKYRSMAEKWLSGLPESVWDASNDLLQLPATSPLCTNCNWDVDFRFDGLKLWNNSVLVAALCPDANSVSVFKQLTEERYQLSKKFHDRFGVVTDSEIYRPHVSLGYFANEEGAQKASNFVDDWNRWFSDALQDSVLSFKNASIYGLTDMVSFFKATGK